MKIKLTEFSLRHFKDTFAGTKILDVTPEEFENNINSNVRLIDSDYADFCKYLIINNFTGAKSGSLPITEENKKYIRTGYSSRTDSELPVFSRWFEFDSYDDIPKAKMLNVVLYSKEQLELEHLANYPDLSNFEFNGVDVDYGVVAILAQSSEKVEPMKPITMMRNHLGKSFGGSGVPIDKEQYLRAVDFWDNHATIK